MSKFFHNTRVYDTSIPSYRANWAFAIGMVPRHDDEEDNESFEKDVFAFGDVGINDFEGKPARVNLKLRRGLKPNARVRYYDGAVQHGFQYPTADWQGVYCLFPENQHICDLPKLFTKDYEEEWFELRLAQSGEGASGNYAKKDIKKGQVSGLYDAATSLEIPFSNYRRLKTMFEQYKTPFNDMYKTFNRYAFAGGFGGLGETLFMSTLSHVFSNHACDHKPNFQDMASILPYTEEFWTMWNPVADRIRSEIQHVTVAARDIKRGEMVTDDYTQFDGFMDTDSASASSQVVMVKEWCGGEDTKV